MMRLAVLLHCFPQFGLLDTQISIPVLCTLKDVIVVDLGWVLVEVGYYNVEGERAGRFSDEQWDVVLRVGNGGEGPGKGFLFVSLTDDHVVAVVLQPMHGESGLHTNPVIVTTPTPVRTGPGQGASQHPVYA